VHERVRKLESRGIIKGFGPRLDPERMGYGLRAFITVVYSTACSHFADRIADWPEIEECHGVAGDECVILKVRTADTHSLSDLLERLRSIPGVERTRTSIILTTYIDNTVIRRPTPANGARASSA
jgi:Lrp/AsnC family leucine-responsive transcriptional regulator